MAIGPKWKKPASKRRLKAEDSQFIREQRKKEIQERRRKRKERFLTKVVILVAALSSSLTFASFHESGNEVISKICNFIQGHAGQPSSSNPSQSFDYFPSTSSKQPSDDVPNTSKKFRWGMS